MSVSAPRVRCELLETSDSKLFFVFFRGAVSRSTSKAAPVAALPWTASIVSSFLSQFHSIYHICNQKYSSQSHPTFSTFSNFSVSSAIALHKSTQSQTPTFYSQRPSKIISSKSSRTQGEGRLTYSVYRPRFLFSSSHSATSAAVAWLCGSQVGLGFLPVSGSAAHCRR